MGLFLEIALLIVTGALLIAAAVFTAEAAAKIHDLKSFETADKRKVEDKDLDTAHRYLTIGAVVAWLGIAAVIAGLILMFIEGAEFAASSLLLGLVIASILLLAIVVAALNIAALSSINKSFQFKKVEKSKSIQHAIIAAVLAGTAVLFVAGVFIFLGVEKQKKKKEEEEAIRLIALKRAERSA